MQLAGFQLDEVIYAVGETVVATATASDGQRVVLKYLDTNHPAPELIARWRHEYAVLRSIDSPYVIKARGLEQVGRTSVLVLEDFAATNLAQLIGRQLLDLSDQLALAVGLTRALSVVHEHRLIHGDLAPKNVLVDPVSLAVKLCDFGLSTRLDNEQRQTQELFLRGTLEYMSPEQTGRTNLDVDYRSDFYSLGVSLYELFTGRKPFQFDDPMTLLHAQIATVPTPLHEIDPRLPPPISGIVQKLLAKHPDERYQSSFGVLHDLELCARRWTQQHRIEPFVPGRADVPERFNVAQRLYGREAEVATLLSAFERVSHGRVELFLIGGHAGIGKTALVGELHRPVVARRGYFVRGKCDQYNRNQPYAALIQAFALLMRQLAVEGAQRRQYWKSRLIEAMGDNAAAVADLIPEVTVLIGTPPPLPLLPAAEGERRLHIAFAQFVKTLSSRGHPLLVFLDDLQWGDAPTLRLLEHLVKTEGECCALIIGAYRDNEVSEGHPLALCRRGIERTHAPLEALRLGPLDEAEVKQLVADTLHCPVETTAPLGALCLAKTQGNPFFLGQFLRSLNDQGDLTYQRDVGAWQWDLAQIERRSMTENVVELMLGRFAALDDATRVLVAQAAHLGNSFDHRDLMAVGERDATATAVVLWPALHAGLVLPLNEDYKFRDSPEQLLGARYRFLHDRVQQAAHESTPESARLALKLQCGRRLLAASNETDLEARLFVILDALNPARALIVDAGEQARLLALNLRGAIRAKASSAYASAVEMLRVARSMLPADAWRRHPEQTLTLFKHLAEAEYLAGHFDVAEAIYPEALAAAPDALAKVTLCLVQVDQYHIQGRFADSLPVLRHALSLLGRDFPDNEAEAGRLFVEEFAQTEALLAQRSEAELLAQAEMTRPEHLLEMQAYYGLCYSAYQTGYFAAYTLVATRTVHTTLQHGQGDLSCIGYVAYVTAMSAMRRPYPACYAMGRLALALAEQRSSQYFRLSVYQYFAPFYQHWGAPLADTLPYLEKGLELGLSGINLLAAGYCALLRSVNRFVMGQPLDELQIECEQGLAFLGNSHQANTAAMLRYGVLQPLRALRGETLDPLRFDTEDCATADWFRGDYRTPSIPLALYSAAMIRHAYLLDAPEPWQASSTNLALIGTCLPDSPSLVEASFFCALGLLKPEFFDAAALTKNIEEAQTYLDRFNLWATHCPANFRTQALLISAELARVRGEVRDAMELFAQAIDAATESGFGHYEGLCNELYARFWVGQQQKQLAMNFIREAYFHYRFWGAQAKCRLIEQQWPQVVFRTMELRPGYAERSSGSLRSSEHGGGLVDLQSLLKASQLLAQEIHLDSLLQKMLDVLMENAGAQFGAIVVVEDDDLMIEAIGNLGGGGRSLEGQRARRRLADTRLDEHPPLPNALIEYVQLTRTTLVANDPAGDERFSQSRYLSTQRPKSVLCLPVQTQGRLVALVYLENNLLEQAFTARHLKTLELLGGQAAISLVNARLYESLERKVAERTEELRQMSMKDGLTGIANRRSLDQRLGVEWRRSQRGGQPLSLMMIDIDHFKLFNDHYGHLDGDRCIRAVAQALEEVVSRSSDLVARYGGEEFAVLLPDADARSASHLADACHAAIATLAMRHEASPVAANVSISIGLCTLTADTDTPDKLILRADQALYQAKRSGRNRVCVWAGDTEPA